MDRIYDVTVTMKSRNCGVWYSDDCWRIFKHSPILPWFLGFAFKPWIMVRRQEYCEIITKICFNFCLSSQQFYALRLCISYRFRKTVIDGHKLDNSQISWSQWRHQVHDVTVTSKWVNCHVSNFYEISYEFAKTSLFFEFLFISQYIEFHERKWIKKKTNVCNIINWVSGSELSPFIVKIDDKNPSSK